MVANQPRHLLSHGMVNIGTCFSYIREFAVHAPFPRQTLRADYLAFAGVEFMVCTFTSLMRLRCSVSSRWGSLTPRCSLHGFVSERPAETMEMFSCDRQ
jgi:hypothetical protein